MKLQKIKLNALASAELNEREMCRILGGGTPGNCQCGCHYYPDKGGSSDSNNDSANDAKGLWSDTTTPPPSGGSGGSGGSTGDWGSGGGVNQVDGTCIVPTRYP